MKKPLYVMYICTVIVLVVFIRVTLPLLPTPRLKESPLALPEVAKLRNCNCNGCCRRGEE